VYVSLEPVPRDRTFDLAVVAKILPGFHINAHEVTLEYLIPTTLDTELPPGFRGVATSYPRGVLRQFKFSPERLSVYEGIVTVRMRLQALPHAPLGANKIPMTFRYQACNEEACLPPVKLPIAADIEIAPAGASARPVHPEIFRTPGAKAQPFR
jgi:thioredoxin:protein disulfide reductase